MESLRRLIIIFSGAVFPLISSASDPLYQFPDRFDVLFELNHAIPPANIAATSDGRIFLSTHQAYGSTYKLLEITSNGEFVPYPNEEMSRSMFSVLGTVADSQGILWFLDTRWDNHTGRVIGWNTKTESLYKIFYITKPYIGDNYILNDLAVDRTNNAIYITDTADATTAGLIILDINSGEVRRVLTGSPSTIPENKNMIIDGNVLPMGDTNARIGVNPITIDHNDEWVYFAPMTSEALYRIHTKDLLDKTLSVSQLSSKVQRYADKPMSDGITIDNDGNVYVSDITNNALGVVLTNGEYRQLFQDEKLAWVEGFANHGNRGILATANQLHRSKAFNVESFDTNQFYIIKFNPLSLANYGR